MDGPRPSDVRRRLLAWFDAHRRDLPWRRTKDPYRILLAEYLLQRTRVVSGTPYYERFLGRFPTVRSLAEASPEDVLRAWEGLGFYGRARNLHAAAKAIVERHAGRIPRDPEVLRGLPGVGPYTAGAVASIAFRVPVPAIDGNATRVIARLFRISEDVSTGAGRRRVGEIASRLVDPARPGPFNQAIMELGATLCAPRSPDCPACPLESLCLARAAGVQADLPTIPRPREPRRARVVFGLVESDGRILVVRRPERGLLGGLWALPGGERPPRRGDRDALQEAVRAQAGIAVVVGPRWLPVAHTFSHRIWSGAIYRCAAGEAPRETDRVRWLPQEEALRLPLVPFHREAILRIARTPEAAGGR